MLGIGDVAADGAGRAEPRGERTENATPRQGMKRDRSIAGGEHAPGEEPVELRYGALHIDRVTPKAKAFFEPPP